MHHPTDRITYTTAFVTPVVEHWLEREMKLYETTVVKCNLQQHFLLGQVLMFSQSVKNLLLENDLIFKGWSPK